MSSRPARLLAEDIIWQILQTDLAPLRTAISRLTAEPPDSGN